MKTKDKILNAAKNLFVNQGFAGTSMSMIAKAAQVNHSLIFHHFKNKEHLWVSVKASIVEEASHHTQALPSLSLSFENFLRALFLQNMRFYKAHPDVVRMINWQRLERSEAKNIGITLTKETETWIDAFKHYQSQNEIDPELKPEFIITFILSIISSATLDPNVFINDEKSMHDYIEFCIRIFKTSLR